MEYKVKFKTGIYNESVVRLRIDTFSSVTLWFSLAPIKRSHIDALKIKLMLALGETI